MANKISVVIDVVTTGAQAGLKNFKTAVADADGAVGKMKAGATTAFDSVKANAGNLAIAGGAAVVAFGVKAVSEFQNVALEAGKMSEALGVPVEDMSRLIEVAGDLGIESGTLEASIGKMNVTAGKSPAYFDDIGAAISRNKDGTINVKDTFLNVTDALNSMPDAAMRAEAAQRIFGKGWKDMAELIGQGATGISESMALVSEGKIIDEEEVEKARDLRAAQDALKDAIEDVSLAVGEKLVPAVTEMTESFIATYEIAEKLKLLDVAGFIAKWGNPVNTAKEALDKIYPSYRNASQGAWDYAAAIEGAGGSFDRAFREYEAMELANRENTEATLKAVEAAIKQDETNEDLRSSTDQVEASIRAAKDSVEVADSSYRQIEESILAAAEAQREMDEDTREATAALEKQRGEMNNREGFLNLQTSLDELKVKNDEAFFAAKSGAEGAEQAVRDAELAQIDLKNEVIDYTTELGNIPPEKTSAILALIDEGKLAEAERALTNLMRERTATGTLIVKSAGKGPGIDVKDRFASGTDFAPGGVALVGEQGPELVNLPRGSKVHTASETAGILSGGGMGGSFVFAPTIYGTPSDEWMRKAYADFQRIAKESQ